MIAIKLIRLLHLISYLLVTSQVLFYWFILCDALKAVSLENYFEQRKVIDSSMAKRFRFMYYTCLALSITAVVVSAGEPASLFFISSASSLILLSVKFHYQEISTLLLHHFSERVG